MSHEGKLESPITSTTTNRNSADFNHVEHRHLQGPENFKPNWWWPYKQIIREMAAEFLGVMLLVICGAGATSQVLLGSNTDVSTVPKGDYTVIALGWAIGLALAVWVSGGVSGGHVNPAVTLSLAVWRGFSWKKVPGYIFAQVFGGFIGAALIYANYFHAIDIFEGGRGVRTMSTAGIFSTYALPYMTDVSCFFAEFLATAVFMLMVLAGTDKGNLAPLGGTLPLLLFIVVLGEGLCLGMETGFAINPARDLGPRLLTSMVGYGKEVYTYRNQYWLWCPIIGTILGAQAGAAMYDVFLYNGPDSIVNKLNAAARDRLRRDEHIV